MKVIKNTLAMVVLININMYANKIFLDKNYTDKKVKINNNRFENNKGQEVIKYASEEYFNEDDRINADWAQDQLKKYNKPIVTISHPNTIILDKTGKRIYFSKKQIDKILGKNRPYTAMTTSDIKKIQLLHAFHKDNIDMYLAINKNTPIKILNELSKSKNTVISSNANNNESFLRYKRYGVLAYIKNTKESKKSKEMAEKIQAMENEPDLNNKELLKKNIEKELYRHIKMYVYYNQTEINRILSYMNIKKELLDIIYMNNLIKQDFQTNLNLINNYNLNMKTLKKLTLSSNIFLQNQAKYIFKIRSKSLDDIWKIVK